VEHVTDLEIGWQGSGATDEKARLLTQALCPPLGIISSGPKPHFCDQAFNEEPEGADDVRFLARTIPFDLEVLEDRAAPLLSYFEYFLLGSITARIEPPSFDVKAAV
jgi:hypothetical protein